MHKVCHQKIHSLFTEQELAMQYHDFEVLKEVPELQKFIKWVRKQPIEFIDKNHTSGRLKEKRLLSKRRKRR